MTGYETWEPNIDINPGLYEYTETWIRFKRCGEGKITSE